MKAIKSIITGIVLFIAFLIFTIAIAIGVPISLILLQSLLFSSGEYLMFISDEIMFLPPMALALGFFVWEFTKLYDRRLNTQLARRLAEDDGEPYDVNSEALSKRKKVLGAIVLKIIAGYAALSEWKSKRKRFVAFLSKAEKWGTTIEKLIKLCYLPVLIIVIYLAMTSYTILYEDTVKVGSPMSPLGTVYHYSEIKAVSVGMEEHRDSYSPYYKVTFSDGKAVNLVGSTSTKNETGFENVLVDFDKKLRMQGVNKNVDRKNL